MAGWANMRMWAGEEGLATGCPCVEARDLSWYGGSARREKQGGSHSAAGELPCAEGRQALSHWGWEVMRMA